MAYVTGTANTLADLLTAIQNACTANGWTLSTGGVLSKGTCYAEVKSSGGYITVRGGTGVDGGGNLTGATDRGIGYLGVALADSTTPVAFGWPVTYFVHVLTSPDEVYVVVNYGVTYYQQIAWGQSAMPGLTGTGNWYCGVTPPSTTQYGGVAAGSGEYTSTRYGGTSLFCRWYDVGTAHGVHHALDSATWADINAVNGWWPAQGRQPNRWNQESILIPIRVYASRPSGFISPVLECQHARFVNIANLSDQQVITLSTDKWKIYPWWRRGAVYDSGSTAKNGSGPCGHAIRYDGP